MILLTLTRKFIFKTKKNTSQVILFWIFQLILTYCYRSIAFSIAIGLHIMHVLLLKEVGINVISCEEQAKIEKI